MNRRRGFSLIEVLMATALLAAGMALAFAALGNATRATEAAETESRRAERLRAVQGFLRRQLENAMLLPMELETGTGQAVVFEAEADRLRFVAPMPGYLSRGGPYVQTFRLARGAGGLRLEFEHQLLTPEGPLETDAEPEVLLEGLAEARFDVRTLADDGEPGPWTDTWDTTAQVPRLVRLQLRFDEARARWPELVVAPRLGQTPPPGTAGGLHPEVPEDISAPGDER